MKRNNFHGCIGGAFATHFSAVQLATSLSVCVSSGHPYILLFHKNVFPSLLWKFSPQKFCSLLLVGAQLQTS